MKNKDNEKVELILEEYLPVIISSVITIFLIIIVFYYKVENIKIPKIEFLLNSIVTLVTTIIGFLLTGLTIIMSMMQTRVMRVIRSHCGEKLLSKYIISPIVWGVILIVNILIMGYFLNSENTVNIVMLISSLFFIIMFITGTIRISYFMKNMFIKISQEYNIEEKKSNIKKAQSNKIEFINK